MSLKPLDYEATFKVMSKHAKELPNKSKIENAKSNLEYLYLKGIPLYSDKSIYTVYRMFKAEEPICLKEVTIQQLENMLKTPTKKPGLFERLGALLKPAVFVIAIALMLLPGCKKEDNGKKCWECEYSTDNNSVSGFMPPSISIIKVCDMDETDAYVYEQQHTQGRTKVKCLKK